MGTLSHTHQKLEKGKQHNSIVFGEPMVWGGRRMQDVPRDFSSLFSKEMLVCSDAIPHPGQTYPHRTYKKV